MRTDVVLIALRREMPKGLGGCPLGHRVTAFTNNKNSNTHCHQSGHSHSALDSEPPLLGTERGTGSGRMRYLCRPKGRLADTSFNSGPASGCREVNGAEERRFTNVSDYSLGTRPALLPVLSIVITSGVELAPQRTGVVLAAASAGRQ